MASEFDAKRIGLAAKDIVVGIAAGVVGVYSPDGAGGIRDAGKGIDTLVGELAPEEDKKKSRSREFEAQDFKPKADAAQATSSADSQTTRAFLASLGWDSAEVAKILKGPTREQQAASGTSEPSGVPAVDGNALKEVIGKVLPMVTGNSVPSVDGSAVKADKASGNKGPESA